MAPSTGRLRNNPDLLCKVVVISRKGRDYCMQAEILNMMYTRLHWVPSYLTVFIALFRHPR